MKKVYNIPDEGKFGGKNLKNKLLKIFDKTFLKFIVVGIINTLFGTAIMFSSFYILEQLQWFSYDINYWTSSALNYLCGSILSYFLNKKYTFEVKETSKESIIRFRMLLFSIWGCETFSLVSFPRSRRGTTRVYRARDWHGIICSIKLRGTTFLGVQTR